MGNRYPKYFKALFEWFCKPELFEELQGDLEEEYNTRLESKGRKNAAWNYRKEVMFMFRPSVLKPFKLESVSFSTGYMFGNYIKTATRNIKKSALFSGINIIGLSVSMAVGLILISGINYQFSFDQFHVNKDRIYRVTTEVQDAYFGTSLYATAPVALAEDYFENNESIDELVRIRSDFSGVGKTESKTLPVSGLYADASFFRIFSFDLLEGSPITALESPNSIILTEETAKRLFDDESAMGKVIDFESHGLFQVTGIVQNPPKNSHIQFNSLVSYSTIDNLVSEDSRYSYLNSYENLNSGYVYVMLNDKSNHKVVESGLSSLATQISERISNKSYQYSLQPLSKITPGKSHLNHIGTELDILLLIILSSLVGVIILSTCFNYTNLSVARALGRTKEVAIRKTLGGSRFQVFLQFIIEAIVISLLSLVVAVTISFSIKPFFYSLSSEVQFLFPFEITPMVVVYFLLFAVMVGIIAGILPALMLSKQKVLKLLKGVGQFQLFKFLNVRKSLIILQFTLSLICIIFASFIMKQFNYSVNFDMGFQRDQILNIRLQGTDSQIVKDEFSKIPEISSISMSSGYLGVGSRSRAWMNNEFSSDSVIVNYMSVDPNYIENHSIPLVAGRGFNEFDYESEDELIIINQRFIEEFNLGNPVDAIDKVIYSPTNYAYRIIGVTSDFHYDRLRNPIGSFFFIYEPEIFQYANFKVVTTDIPSLMEKVQISWIRVNKNFDLYSEFYDERVEEAYSFYKIAFGIIGLATLLTVLIASIGLLGIVVYTSQTRRKEVAIRKVLGADEKGLVYLLSKSFLTMLFWASGLSVLITYLFFTFVLFPQETYHAKIGFWDFGIGVFIILGLGLLTTTTQTLRVARSNPVESIQNE
ncbi:MAG: ABC transporter permease [Balneola sp.]|nr:MAG: ABC transporter permease [Balneola sp.]